MQPYPGQNNYPQQQQQQQQQQQNYNTYPVTARPTLPYGVGGYGGPATMGYGPPMSSGGYGSSYGGVGTGFGPGSIYGIGNRPAMTYFGNTGYGNNNLPPNTGYRGPNIW